MKTNQLKFILVVLIALVLSSNLFAAEIQLKSTASVSGNVIRLGDIAQIYAASSVEQAQLAKTEIGLAPSANTSKVLKVSEIKQALRLRGVAIGKHSIKGAANVKVVRQYANIRNVQYTQVSQGKIQAANSKMSRYIKQYLSQQAPNRGPWTINLNLTGQQAKKLMALGKRFNIVGGKSPWSGIQEFEVIAITNRGRVQIPVRADVSEAEGIVTTVRALERGMTLQASDVKIIQPKRGYRVANSIHSIKDVVGKVLSRSVSSNQPLSSSYIKEKILVKRGEGVTVYSYADGILIKTIARARESGGLNQTIEVESGSSRERFFAKVRAPQIVVINASSRTVTVKK